MNTPVPENTTETTPSAAPDVDSARRRLDTGLRRSARVSSTAQNDLRAIELRAPLMQKKLLRALPGLEQAITDAPDEDARADAQRAYLQAKQNIERCEQCFQMARRERVIASHN